MCMDLTTEDLVIKSDGLPRLGETNKEPILNLILTPEQVGSLKEFIDFYFIASIQDDTDIDNLAYIYNVIYIWKRCEDFLKGVHNVKKSDENN